MLDTRFRDVRELYSTTELGVAEAILKRYGADYVVVGPRERRAYGVDGVAKFKTLGNLVFSAASGRQEVAIYKLHLRALP